MPLSAAERKRRERAKRRSAGRRKVELSIPGEWVDRLREATAGWGGDITSELTALVRIELPRHLERMRKVAEVAGPICKQLAKYSRYREFLEKPGAEFVIRGEKFTASEFQKLQADLNGLVDSLKRVGWSDERITKYIKYLDSKSG